MTEFRLVVVGAGGVGKSALSVRFIQGEYIEKYDPTIEDCYRKLVEVDGSACLLEIMDTAGQEEYGALRDQYLRTGQGFLLVYSIVSPKSWDAVSKFHERILRVKENQKDIPIVVVGNKADLGESRAVTSEQGRAFASRVGCGFLETSAKLNSNVNEMFFELVRRIKNVRKSNDAEELLKKKKKKEIQCILC